MTGYRGFFYHFLDMQDGARFATVELSTIDTALLMGGVLFCQSYYDRDVPGEAMIRAYADSLYRRVEWTWIQPRAPLVNHRWRPEDGFSVSDWKGYDESMLLYVLALGSPTYPIDASAWEAYTRTNPWGDFHGQAHVNFEPLFGHQYSHVWVDFRGIADSYMRGRGIDYFENSRRATLAQRAYAIANPEGYAGYGEHAWGVTACDGPVDAELTVGGRPRRFISYAGRGMGGRAAHDDGTRQACLAEAEGQRIAGSSADAMEGGLAFLEKRKPTFSDEHPSGRWRAYDYEELVARDKCSLDLFWLKDEGLLDADDLPEPDEIALEIAEDLRSAVAQIEEILGDLQAPPR